jgi:enoyl-CoA hydratase/carnithine racemase
VNIGRGQDMEAKRVSLNLERRGTVAIVNLLSPINDPARGIELRTDLAEICKELEADQDIRVIVFVLVPGPDATFEASMSTAGMNAELFGRVPKPIDSIARTDRPNIAVIAGDALGAALELAMACDIRIATPGSRFGLPQIVAGLLPSEGGTQILPRLVGRAKALELILTGEVIDAEEALRIGLVNKVVPAGEQIETAVELARDIASKAPVALRYAREAIRMGLDMTLEQGLRTEGDLYLLLFSTKDRTEGIRSFREQKPPHFTGE